MNTPESGNNSLPPLRIIALAPNDWHYVWMNRQQILSRLGKKHHITYSQGPHFFYNRNGKAYRDAPWFSRIQPTDNVCVDVVGKIPARWPRFEYFDRAVMKQSVRRWIRSLAAFSESPLVAYVFHPKYTPYLAFLNADIVIYHAYDLFRLAPGWSDTMEKNELHLLQKADVALASSSTMAEVLTEFSNRDVVHIPNGVDFESFQAPTSIPADFENISSPRLGYAGRITDKLDFTLLHDLARSNPEWNLVMVGPIEKLGPEQRQKYEFCAKHENVHFLGNRNQKLIPQYLNAIDVGLMPYRTDGLWTEAIYPLKLHEYLAAGLPIVSSPIKTMMGYPEVVDIASSAEEWQSKIKNALEPGNDENKDLRKSIARLHSWDAITAQIEQKIKYASADRFGI